MTRSTLRPLFAVGSFFFAAALCQADSIIYANNAGNSGVQVYDANTGALMDTIQTPEMARGNGRGVVKVGDVLYYTEASSPSVFAYNVKTKADMGSVFTVAGSRGLATMAYDGTNFFLGDYSGTNNVYKYSPSGTLLGTIPLSGCTSYCDGLEYAQGNLLSNEKDGAYGAPSYYDVYSTGGALKTSHFITANYGATGIAFDGTNYWVSDLSSGQLYEYDTSGMQVGVTTLASPTHLVEDLSFDYRSVLPPSTVPEPASLFLLGSAFGLGLFVRRIRG